MHVIGFISLEHFYAQARGVATEVWVLHHEKAVLDLSASAEARGVAVGMGVSEARTILAGEGHFEAWEPEPYRNAQELWLNLLAAYCDAIEPVGQHAAFIDLSGHPNPDATSNQLLVKLKERLGLNIRLGLASARYVAQLAVERGDPNFVALKNPKRFVACLPVEALPVPAEASTRLRFLGYATIGQVAELSLDLLRPVFGEIALDIARAAKGRGDAQVAAVYPPRCVSARFAFDGPVETSDVLDLGLIELAGQLATCLSEHDGFSERMELFTESEDGHMQVMSRTFARSIHTARDALAALRLMLAAPPAVPIVGIRARLRDVKRSRRVQASLGFPEPLPRYAGLPLQGEEGRKALPLAEDRKALPLAGEVSRRDVGVPGLYSASETPSPLRGTSPARGRGPEIDDRTTRSLTALAHIRNAFGDGVIQTGSELHEPRWKQVRRIYRAANGWAW